MEKPHGGSLKVTIMLYFLMFAYAIFTIMIGTQLLILVDEFGLLLSEGGVFTVVVNVGCMLGIVISGFFLGKYNKQKLVMITYFVFAVALLAVGFSKTYTGFLLLLFLIGISIKFFDAAINATVSQLNPVNKGLYINLLHCSYATGSFAGPLFTTLLMDKGIGWRNTYVCLGVICLLILTAFFFVQKSSRGIEAENGTEQECGTTFLQLMEPRVIGLMGILLCYCGHQIGINSWMPAYMQEVIGTDMVVANLSLSVFWIGLIVSRLISAMLTRYIQLETILKFGNLFGAALLTLGVLSKNPIITIIGVGCSGLFAGAAIPLVITIGYSWFPKSQGKMSTVLFLCIAGGAVVFPWLMGFISKTGGLYMGMILNAVCLIGAMVISFVIAPKSKKPKNRQEIAI